MLVLGFQLIAQALAAGPDRVNDETRRDRSPTYAPRLRRVRRPIGRTIAESAPAWPSEPAPAPRQPEHRGRPGRRPRLRRPRPVRQRDRHAERGPARRATGCSFTDYHTTPLCSPVRAALLTGINPHRAGFAFPANFDPGYPAYTFELPDDAPTLAESLRDAGYATFARRQVAPDPRRGCARRRRHGRRGRAARLRPLLRQPRGLHQPARPAPAGLGQPPVRAGVPRRLLPHRRPHRPGDRDDPTAAGQRRRASRSSSTSPTTPCTARCRPSPPTSTDYAGRYDAGWDARPLGAVPPPGRAGAVRRRHRAAAGATTSPACDVPPWDEPQPTSSSERFARYMEVYAAAVDNVDQNLGRLLDGIERLRRARQHDRRVHLRQRRHRRGRRPRAPAATTASSPTCPALPADWDRDVDRDLDLIGGPQTTVHYPRGWGQASNTPFRLYKGDTYAGGVRAPLVVHWPAGGLPGRRGDDGLRRQYVHVTDLTPDPARPGRGRAAATERHGLTAPRSTGSARRRCCGTRPPTPGHGPSSTPRRGATAATRRDDWKIVTHHRPGTAYDDDRVAALRPRQRPDRDHGPGREAARAWWPSWPRRGSGRPGATRVFPLDRPSVRRWRCTDRAMIGCSEPVTLLPGHGHRWSGTARPSWSTLRDVAITASFDLPPGDAGVLVAHGDQGGGYCSSWIDDRGRRPPGRRTTRTASCTARRRCR